MILQFIKMKQRGREGIKNENETAIFNHQRGTISLGVHDWSKTGKFEETRDMDIWRR